MADEITPLPTPHNLTTEELARLTEALRHLTDGVLDMRSQVVTLAERFNHLITLEQTQSGDFRELRLQLGKIIDHLFQASKDIAVTAVEVKTTGEGVKQLRQDISGSFSTVTAEELREEREVTTVKAITVIVEKAKALPGWLKWFSSTTVGAGLYHLIQRLFHH